MTDTERGRVGIWFACAIALLVVVLAVVAAAAAPSPGGSEVARVTPTEHLGVPYGPRPEQVIDVRLPAVGRDPMPVVVYAHGGGWIAGSRADVPDVIVGLGDDLGVAVVSIDYRLVRAVPDGSYTDTFPAAMWDLDRALRFVRLHAAEWGLDAERLVVAGASAGGHLAALAGADPGRFVDPELPRELASVSPAVAGVIDFVGPSDLWTFPDAGGWAPGLATALLGCAPGSCDRARVDDASVVPHLQGRPPPAYFAYGEDDVLVVPATQGEPLAKAWARQRGESTIAPQRGGVWYEVAHHAGHNFTDGLDGGLVSYWLLKVLDGSLR